MDTHSSKENTPKNAPSRRKFVSRIGALSLLAAVAAAIKLPFSSGKHAIACKPGSMTKKIKMLTQDGSLVEIDESLISPNRKKISDTELQHWIKNKKI
jgi:hypothetical protein